MIHKITILSKEGCHLCERAIEKLQELSRGKSFDLSIVDITKDRSLFDRYFLKIPVIQLDGKDVLEAELIALPEDCNRKLTDLVKRL